MNWIIAIIVTVGYLTISIVLEELYPSGICWTMNGEFFKVSTLTDFWVLEWTDNHSYASNYCFEDIDPMPYDISEQEIIWQVDKLLL